MQPVKQHGNSGFDRLFRLQHGKRKCKFLQIFAEAAAAFFDGKQPAQRFRVLRGERCPAFRRKRQNFGRLQRTVQVQMQFHHVPDSSFRKQYFSQKRNSRRDAPAVPALKR